MLHCQLLKSSSTNEKLMQSDYVTTFVSVVIAEFKYVMHIDHVAHVVVTKSNL
jgi:hypothetical protein